MHKSPSWVAANDAVGKLKDKWANFGGDLGRTPGHRKVDSVQQRILSEEGRAF